jgi:hypothetical protein
MKESFCKIRKREVDYYEWDSKCCRCGKIKKRYDIYAPSWRLFEEKKLFEKEWGV